MSSYGIEKGELGATDSVSPSCFSKLKGHRQPLHLAGKVLRSQTAAPCRYVQQWPWPWLLLHVSDLTCYNEPSRTEPRGNECPFMTTAWRLKVGLWPSCSLHLWKGAGFSTAWIHASLPERVVFQREGNFIHNSTQAQQRDANLPKNDFTNL